jgi:hypothetical protein
MIQQSLERRLAVNGPQGRGQTPRQRTATEIPAADEHNGSKITPLQRHTPLHPLVSAALPQQ